MDSQQESSEQPEASGVGDTSSAYGLVRRAVDTTSGTVSSLTAGSGEQQAVFLHGVGARADRWKAQILASAAVGLAAHALDFPGHGHSMKGGGLNYSAQDFAQVVTEYCDRVGVSAARFVGTSLGAHVAGLVAMQRPDLVSSLALVGPMGFEPIGADACRALAGAVRETSRDAIERKLRRVVHDDGRLVTPTWVEEEWRLNNSPGAADGFRSLAAYLMDADRFVLGDRLAQERPDLSALLVWGSEDVLVSPALAPAVLADLPHGSEVHLIPGTSHAPYLEAPLAFTSVLFEFWTKRTAKEEAEEMESVQS